METRRTPRIKINVKVVLNIDRTLDQKIALVNGNRFEAAVFDITTLGIAIIVKYLLPKGLVVDLEVDGTPFGLKDIIKTKGEIRYCNYIRPQAYKCGIKFADITEKQKEYITKFVSTHERRKEVRFSLYTAKN